jgi:long-chain fatty acid transport protein
MTRLHPAFKLTPLAALLLASSAFATNGYFPHGYGIRAKGMGGASVAMTEDSMGGANNPAGMVWVGTRLDVGMDLFSPRRDATRSDALPVGSTLNGSVDSQSKSFLVPEFGYNRMLGSDMSLGVTVYGNGGMNTNYPQGPFQCPTGPTTVAPANMLCGGGNLGVDLMQLIVAPTISYKLNAQHSVGASLLLGYQQFKAYGLQAFDTLPNFSSAPGSVTNNGYARSHGFGIRVGYLGRLTDTVSVGATFAPKMNMSRFEEYKGLFADNGDFDIPSHYTIGLAFTPTPAVTVALDYQRINYSGVGSVGNPSSVPLQLGSPGGPGFGWKDVNVVKLGVQWRATNAWTLRAGYNHGDNPVRSEDVSFNILAPGVMKQHFTAGFSWAMNASDELSGSLMLAPRQSVTGSSLFNAVMGPGAGGSETVRMRQTAIGLAWSHKF